MYTPRLEQKEALRAQTRARTAGRRRVLVVMATGLGKTVVAAHAVRKYYEETGDTRAFMFLCHQNDILEQARATFQEMLGPEYELGYLNGRHKDLHPVDGLFASFDSMRSWREEFDPEEFCVIVVDESHHSQAPTYRPTLSYFWPDVLAGYSATPDRADLQDIRDIYGKEVFSLPIEEALARGLLTKVDYRFIMDEFQNLDVIKTPIGKMSVSTLNRQLFVPKRDEEIVRIIAEHTSTVKDPHTMIFCPSIEYCERLAQLMPAAAAIHHKLPKKELRRRLQAFRKGELKTVLTVDMFNEGIDVPEENIVVFLRSTSSRTIFLQQLGRGLRKAKGKRKVLVLDFVANCERLEMVHKLWRDVQGLATSNANGTRKKQDAIEITAGRVEFTEVALDVLKVLEAVRTGYTKEMLIRQLRELAVRLGRTPTAKDIKEDPGVASCPTFRKFFDTIEDALIAAHLPLNVVNQETVIKQLRLLAEELGHTPLLREVVAAENMVGAGTIKRLFGTYNKALEAAGLPLRRHSGLSKSSLTERLRTYIEKTGEVPTLAGAKKAHRDGKIPEPSAYVRYFKTWNRAVEATGYEPNLVHGRSKKELTRLLKELAKRLKRSPTIKDWQEHRGESNLPDFQAFVGAFGSWSLALKAAGLTVNMTFYDDKEELKRLLKALAGKLGHTPTGAELEGEPGYPSKGVFEKQFGSWNKALRAAGLTPRSRKDYSRKELIEQLQRLGKRLKRTPRPKDIKADRSVATEATFKRHFGGVEEAIEAAGFGISDHINNHTDRELIKELRKLADEFDYIPTPKEIDKASSEGKCFKYQAYHHRLGRFLTDRRGEIFGTKYTRT
ncbi:MAG TPA: DEAD/DEAH box helicase family protein [Candidatus Saccharimonadales bacterium]|nr:DEAD/DEAH box helicase family protein [Candidatus Saccharimonadales bacterium]